MSAMTSYSTLKRGGDDTATKLAAVLYKKIHKEIVVPRSFQDILKGTPTPPPAPVYSPEELKDRNEVTTLYFAYGKNLTEKYMAKNFPDCTLQLIALAYVRDYKYTLNSAGYVKAVRTEWKTEDKDPGLYGLLVRLQVITLCWPDTETPTNPPNYTYMANTDSLDLVAYSELCS
jgi:hypothetical protein